MFFLRPFLNGATGIVGLVSIIGASALSLMVASPAAAGCVLGEIFACPPKIPRPAPSDPKARVFRNSYVFDAHYYLDTYQDLREEYGRNNTQTGGDHWQLWGIAEGRQGHPAFSAKYYLSQYNDLSGAYGSTGRESYIRAMEHWILFGIKECRKGSPDFDPRYYLNNNPDIASNVGASNCQGAIDHWVGFGKKEGRRGAP